MKILFKSLLLTTAITAMLGINAVAAENETAFTASNGLPVTVSASERLTAEGVAGKISALQDANARLIEKRDAVIVAHPGNAAVIQKVTDSANNAIEMHKALIEYYENYSVSVTAPTPPVSANLTYEQAEEIALTEVGGGTVHETEAENDDGYLIYEVDVRYSGQKHKIEVDAVTGMILKHKIDD